MRDAVEEPEYLGALAYDYRALPRVLDVGVPEYQDQRIQHVDHHQDDQGDERVSLVQLPDQESNSQPFHILEYKIP